jgi:hypothetical protein
LQKLVVIIFGGIVLLFTGASAVAEERQLGTLDWQLASPPSIRRQWWIKASVALCVTAVLGLGLPLLLLRLGLGDGFKDLISADRSDLPALAASAGLVMVALTSAGLYASTLARNTVTAVCTALVVLAAAGVLLAACQPISVLWRSMRAETFNQDLVVLISSSPPPPTFLRFLGSCTIVPSILWLFLAGRNFRFGLPTGQRLRTQLAVLAGGLIVLALVLVVVDAVHFEWELRTGMWRPPPTPPPAAQQIQRHQIRRGFPPQP